MIKIKKNPYRSKSDISEEDAYKLGETLELIFQLELLSRNDPSHSTDKKSIVRALNLDRYMNKITSQFSNNTKDSFNKGRKSALKTSYELFDILNKNELKKYQNSLIEEVEDLKYKNSL